jgi:hypothetical protein
MMMNKSVCLAAVCALLAATSWAAFAADKDPGVNARQHRQNERIEQGVHSGQVTHKEAKSLRSEQRAIRREERKDKADGKLTATERKGMYGYQNQASKDVYAAKHNADLRQRTP